MCEVSGLFLGLRRSKRVTLSDAARGPGPCHDKMDLIKRRQKNQSFREGPGCPLYIGLPVALYI